MTRSAIVMQVIKTVSVTGEGVAGDPVREVIHYWDTDGTLLAEVDATMQREIARLARPKLFHETHGTYGEITPNE